jgi:hypothetical protein
MKGNINGSLLVEFVGERLISNLLCARNSNRKLVGAVANKLAEDSSNALLNGTFGFVHTELFGLSEL